MITYGTFVAVPDVVASPNPSRSIPLTGSGSGSTSGYLDIIGAESTPAKAAESTPAEATVLTTTEPALVANANEVAADRITAKATDIPVGYLALYRAAATTCPGLDWSVLAAIGKFESDHGRSTLPGVRTGANSHGAKGPMQFLQSTFNAVTDRHPLPPGGATPPSPHNSHDAVHAAAAYLCDNGARDNRNLSGAIFTYNHSRAYVNKVLGTARDYRQATPNPPATPPNPPAPAKAAAPPVEGQRQSKALAVVAFAQAQRGKPYVWGGNGNPGFDCSGLTKAAFAAAGITLPRTAHSQYKHGPRLPAGAALQPGDLLFFGTARKIHHVGISLGGTLMIHAPTFGQTVKIEDYRRFRDFAGASRPAT
ncbi:MAG TPA: C40 family peptidase [Pseudonocardiaceae bacterium]|nr:C40 family peptidase [Pseudonocardiaceae bacterium]